MTNHPNICTDCGEPTTAYDVHRIVLCRCGKCAEKLGKAWLEDKKRWSNESKETECVADLSEQ